MLRTESLVSLSPSVHDGWMAGVAQAIVPVRTLDRQILPPTTAEVSSAGRDRLRLSVSEHKLYRADSGAECRNRNTNNTPFSRNPEKRSLDDALMIRHKYIIYMYRMCIINFFPHFQSRLDLRKSANARDSN